MDQGGDDGDNDDNPSGKQTADGSGVVDGTGGTSLDGGVDTGGKSRVKTDVASSAAMKKARVE